MELNGRSSPQMLRRYARARVWALAAPTVGIMEDDR